MVLVIPWMRRITMDGGVILSLETTCQGGKNRKNESDKQFLSQESESEKNKRVRRDRSRITSSFTKPVGKTVHR